MTSRKYALFDTALGPCGLAWGEAGVCAVTLPENTRDAARARLARRAGDGAQEAPLSGAALAAAQDIVALLSGDKRDLAHIELDYAGVGAFERQIYALARAIPPGETRTYGALAAACGQPGAARAVGRAMGRNPFPIIVPCHRVLAASGMGGFSARGGVNTKLRMLEIEGALQPTLF